MKRILLSLVAVVAVAACGATTTATGGTSPAPKGTVSPGAGGTSVKPKAGINIRLSGAVNGSSTTVDSTRANSCAPVSAALTIHTLALNIFPVINGTTYHFALIVGQFTGPTTITLPDDIKRITEYVATVDDANHLWGPETDTTGTIQVDATGGGKVSLMGTADMLDSTSKLDQEISWTCAA